MNSRQHALLAKQLIDACGKVEEIVERKACRAKSTQLYAYCDPKAGAFMPADVVVDLQAYCGEPLYSRAMSEDRPHTLATQHVLTEACETAEAASELQKRVRLAAADGRLSPNDRQAIEAEILRLEDQARELRASVERAAS